MEGIFFSLNFIWSNDKYVWMLNDSILKIWNEMKKNVFLLYLINYSSAMLVIWMRQYIFIFTLIWGLIFSFMLTVQHKDLGVLPTLSSPPLLLPGSLSAIIQGIPTSPRLQMPCNMQPTWTCFGMYFQVTQPGTLKKIQMLFWERK